MGAMVLAVSLFPMGACIGTAVATAAYAARRAQTVDVLLGLLDGDDAGGLADGGSGGGGGDGRASGVGAPLSLSAALAFPFVASAALLFMFFFYAGISALLAVVVTLSSAMALSYLFFPALDGVMGRGGGAGPACQRPRAVPRRPVRCWARAVRRPLVLSLAAAEDVVAAVVVVVLVAAAAVAAAAMPADPLPPLWTRS